MILYDSDNLSKSDYDAILCKKISIIIKNYFLTKGKKRKKKK